MKVFGRVDSFEMWVDETGMECPEGWIEMSSQRPDGPDSLDFTARPDGTWAITPATLKAKAAGVELEWQQVEMAVIANQLLALEEEAPDALPGSRKDWLQYRTRVRLWHESPDFPTQEQRPVRPS
ncbi:hypothetical protein PF66_06429 [Pseudomonas asplenii]|uniref:Virus tail fibre assembly protein, lambda gpK n=1 Tax=Pseudomonas asplenii TaxID=53407 RepID=A0A0N0E102_9PSED|nr:hypothetical protein [Pseudomonas fuscovaginae]KPA87084.1 hypothetical protein PF66_06429 [Pseudomonas fuscovaginae]